MTVNNGYCTFQEVKDFFKQAPIESVLGQSKVEALIDRYGLEVERLSKLAWRPVTVTEELHTLFPSAVRTYFTPLYEAHLKHIYLRSITELWIYDGDDGYTDWVADAGREEGRGKDYFFDIQNGIVYVRGWFFPKHSLDCKVSYIHGNTQVDTDAWKLNLLYVCEHIMIMPEFVKSIPDNATSKRKSSLEMVQLEIEKKESRLAVTFSPLSVGI